MNEIARSLSRGWGIAVRAAVPLLVGGVVWTGLNVVTQGLLLGPALVGLFVVALKTHEGRRAEIADNFAAFSDVAAPLVAGLGFVLPFSLTAWIAAGAGAIPPLPVAAALLAWFALGMPVFTALADEPGSRLVEALRRARDVATAGERGSAAALALARHLGLGAGLLLLGWVVAQLPFTLLLAFVLLGPLSVAVLTAWYAQRSCPSEGARPLPEPAPAQEAADEALPAAPPRGTEERAAPEERPETSEPDWSPGWRGEPTAAVEAEGSASAVDSEGAHEPRATTEASWSPSPERPVGRRAARSEQAAEDARGEPAGRRVAKESPRKSTKKTTKKTTKKATKKTTKKTSKKATSRTTGRTGGRKASGAATGGKTPKREATRDAGDATAPPAGDESSPSAERGD